MHKIKYLPISIILVVTLSLAGLLSFEVSARPLVATSPVLGASGSYSVLAGTTITNTGPTNATGNVGVAPGTAITGFPPGVAGGGLHPNDASAIAAQADNLVVFGVLDQTCDQTFGAVDLAATFPTGVGPGVYCSTSSFTLTGNLNLTGSGVWIFKTASTLITAPGSSVTGGDPCNVWWRIGSSATLDTNTSFIGNIFALTSITMNTGATLNGRALAQTGAVTLDSNTITGPNCSAQQATSTSTATTGPTATATTGPAATVTTGPAATATTGPAATTAPTATRLPVVTGLPPTGGGPIQNDGFPWSLMIVGGFSAVALVFGIRAYRSTNRSR